MSNNFKKYPSELVNAVKAAVKAAKAFKAQEKEVAPRAPRERRPKPTREQRSWRRKARAALRKLSDVQLYFGTSSGLDPKFVSAVKALGQWDGAVVSALEALETLKASGGDTAAAKAAAFAATRAAQDRQYERAAELAAPAVKAARQKYDQRLKAAKAAAIAAGIPGPRLWEVKAFQTKAAQLESERETEIGEAYAAAADAAVMEAEEVAKAAWDAYGSAVRTLRDDVAEKFNALTQAEVTARAVVASCGSGDGFAEFFASLRAARRRSNSGFARKFREACEALDARQETPRLLVGKTGKATSLPNIPEMGTTGRSGRDHRDKLSAMRMASRRAAKLAATYKAESARIQKAEVDLESILAAI